MASLLLLNGSPRGARSNSLKMLSRVAEGWQAAQLSGTATVTRLDLADRSGFARAVEAFGQTDLVLLGFPLYTDSMPALVMTYIEAIGWHCGRAGNPRLAFLVQSGFSEAAHSRPVERYLEKLASRLGCAYAGTIIRGGGESLQAMPEAASNKLWAGLCALGASLATDGRFDPQLLKEVARAEHLSAPRALVMMMVLKLRPVQFYWNAQLKKNRAWDRRYATPYAKPRASEAKR
jgi:hypothetical protein